MLVIKVGKNEKIDRALKRFKKKFRNTQILKQLKEKKQHIKKSTKRRVEMQKAVYNRIKKTVMKNKDYKPLFKNLNMNPARGENETYEEYVIRRKKVNFIIKRYRQAGREVFESVFPDGVTIEAMDNIITDVKNG